MWCLTQGVVSVFFVLAFIAAFYGCTTHDDNEDADDDDDDGVSIYNRFCVHNDNLAFTALYHWCAPRLPPSHQHPCYYLSIKSPNNQVQSVYFFFLLCWKTFYPYIFFSSIIESTQQKQVVCLGIVNFTISSNEVVVVIILWYLPLLVSTIWPPQH